MPSSWLVSHGNKTNASLLTVLYSGLLNQMQAHLPQFNMRLNSCYKILKYSMKNCSLMRFHGEYNAHNVHHFNVI